MVHPFVFVRRGLPSGIEYHSINLWENREQKLINYSLNKLNN